MYKVVGPTRTRAFRVLWALTELEQPFEHLPVPPRSEEAQAVNPSGKVPTLIVDGTPITDSVAILTYLADKHGKLTSKAGTLKRAQQDSLTQFLLDEFDAILWAAARHSFVLPKEQRVPAVKDSLKWEFTHNQKTLCARMGDGPYLCGEMFTISDIVLTHCGNWAEKAGFDIVEPTLRDYLNRVRERPAYKTVDAA